MITLLKRLQNGLEERPPWTELTQWPQQDVVKGEGVGEGEVAMKVMKESSALNGCHPDSAGSLRQGGHLKHQPEKEEEPAGERVVGSEYHQVEVQEEV